MTLRATQAGTIPSTATANTFQIAASVANAIAGTAVNTSGTQSGTHTGTSGASLATGTPVNVSGPPLTAGDWDVDVVFNFTGATTTTTSSWAGSISTTSATHDFTGGRGYGMTRNSQAYNQLAAGQNIGFAVPPNQGEPPCHNDNLCRRFGHIWHQHKCCLCHYQGKATALTVERVFNHRLHLVRPFRWQRQVS